jgi:hypothetical protein
VHNITRVCRGARFVAAAVTAVLAFNAVEVRAGAITVSEGETIVFTFDFTKLSGAQPPYRDVRIYTGIDFASVDAGLDRCRYTLYRDGNAVDPDSSIVACGIDMFEGGTEDSGWLDGLLSLAITVLSGEITLDPHAIAFSAFGPHGYPITPRVMPRIRVIAEPAHAALFLLLGAVAFRSVRVRGRSANG